MQKDKITGVVLAGGRGLRMGAVDKGLQLFRGKPLALHVLERLLPQVGSLAINANRNLEHYSEYGYPVWADEFEGFHGPLAGLHAALTRCDTQYMVTAPCDSPFLPADLVTQLAAGLESQEAEVAVAVTGEAAPYQRQPVFCLLRSTLATPLRAYLEDGGRRVDHWFRTRKTVEVHFDDENAFRNINTLDDLRQFEDC